MHNKRLLAHALLLLLVTVSAASLYYSKVGFGKAAVLGTRVQAEQAELSLIQSRLQELTQLPEDTASKEPMPLAQAERSISRMLKDGTAAHNITLSSKALLALKGGLTSPPESTLIGGLPISQATFTVDGTYGDYQSLLSYLELLKGKPAAVTSFQVRDKEFSLTFQVYGEK